MRKISIQLHVTPAEIEDFINDVHRELTLFVSSMSRVPFRLTTVEDRFEGASVDRICLSPDRPNLDCDSWNDFLSKNPGLLYLDIGQLSKDGLQESFFSAQTEDLELLKLWKEVARKTEEKNLFRSLGCKPQK